ncbi:MAG: sodium ion-translocating decarboxylase subunit beta, partial [Dethiobacteria bacterium]
MLSEFAQTMGFFGLTIPKIIMIIVSCILLYLGIVKNYEPLLLVPIGFGALLVNLPLNTLLDMPVAENNFLGGLLHYLSLGVELGIYPPLIFLGVGAMTDFGPLLANPITLLLGAAAQLGIFVTLLGALFLGFSPQESSAIGIIGGADGPTAIFLANRLAPELLGSIAIAAYSYMALVPIIQPPIMKLLTTKKERVIVMEQLRVVSRTEKILFPIVVTIIIGFLLPEA